MINKTYGGLTQRISIRKVFAISLFVILLVAGGVGAVGSDGVWVQVPDMPNSHVWGSGIIPLDNGKVLVTTGMGTGNGLTSASELFDPQSLTWTTTGIVNQARLLHGNAIVKLNDGKVMIAGDEGPYVSDLKSVELYDPSTGTWSYTTPLNTPRRYQAIITLQNGKVLVTGGARGLPDNNRFLSSTEIYDSATKQWTYSGNLNVPREGAPAIVLLKNGKVLLAEGYTQQDKLIDKAEIYNSDTGVWTVSQMPYALGGATMTVLDNGKVLVSGGSMGQYTYTATVTNKATLYDPNTNTWTPTGSLHTARAGHKAALLTDGKVLVIGGGTNSTEVYDSATGQWTAAAETRQSSHNGIAILQNGDILAVGGDPNGLTAELFTDVTPTTPPPLNISGFKINNAGSGMQGWNITLTNSTMQKSMLTGADGSYIFTNLVNGTYNVAEEMQTGWTNISPISQQVIINGADMPNINFTNAPSPVPPPPTPGITVISPNGGEDWQTGLSQDIKWSYTGNPEANIKIELLKSGMVNRIIKSKYSIGSQGTGSYNWKIPSNQVPGTDYKIRITSTTNSAYTDTSNGEFIISTTGLAFPLKGYTPYNASVTSIMDHSMATPYQKDGIVRAFDGEEGVVEKGCKFLDKDTGIRGDCDPTNYNLYENWIVAYKNKTSPGTIFLPQFINYGDEYLWYDGHPGYDYAFGTNISAPANGTLCVVLNNNENDTETGKLWRDPKNCPYYKDVADQTQTNWNGWHTLYLIHKGLKINGVKGDYITAFLHSDDLETSVRAEVEKNGYAKVSKNQHIAQVGSKGAGDQVHTHLEIFKRKGTTWDRVDPYGDGGNNILWEYRNK